MSCNHFASGSDAGNRSGELGGITKSDHGSTPGRGCGVGDEREGGNSRDSETELAADGSSQSEERREGHAERYDVALHSDGVSSPIVLGQQLAGENLASGNISPTIEPVLGSEVLSLQQRGVIRVTETKVESGSRSLPSQRFSSPTTKVEMKLSAPLPPESRLEGAFESSASLFEAILDSSEANKDLSGAGNQPFESPKRATGKPEDGQPGSNEDYGGLSTPTKTLKKAPRVKLELDRAAFTPLGRTGPRKRHENHLSGASLRTSSQQSGPVEGLENKWAGSTSAERHAHLSGRVKTEAAAVTKYLSKPSQEAGSSNILTSYDNQSQGTPGHGPGTKGPVATTLHEYNVHNTANDIKRYRIAGLLYPGPEYFSHAPPSGPSSTRPYHRDPGVYPAPTNPHQAHLNDARALAARNLGTPQSIQGPYSTMHSTFFQSQFTETPSNKTRNEFSVPSKLRLTHLADAGALAAHIPSPLNLALHSAQGRFIQPQHAHSIPIPDPSIPRPAHLKDAQVLAARIPRALNLALSSAQAPSKRQQAQKASLSQNTRSAHSSLLLNIANTQPDSLKLQLARRGQIQADIAPVPGAPQSAQDPFTQLQPAPHFPFAFPPGRTMPGTSAPYTWHHRGAPPPLPNPPNIKDPITQLSLYERQIAVALSPKATAFMTENTAIFFPILEANGTIRRMVLQELPALTPKYCDEFCKFSLRLTLTIRSLRQLNLSAYYAAIRIKMVRDLETDRILLFNKMQERIRLESEMLGEQMERNGAVLSTLRRARPPSPSGDGVEAVAVGIVPAVAAVVTVEPSTLLPHSSSAPSTVVRLSTGAHEAVTANTSAQQETLTRHPVEVSSPPVRVERPSSRTAEERFAEFQAALARNGVRASGGWKES